MPGFDEMDPNLALAELGQIDLASNSMEQVLARICELVKRTISGAAEASVTLVQDNRPTTAAWTGDLALRLDERQYERGYGPCLDAAATGETLYISDMATEDRWPDYTPRALEQGARSSLSVALPVQQAVTGALNIYAVEPRAFDQDAIELAQRFAGYGAVALANAHLYTSTATLAQQMQEAISSRAVIEQAKGILIGGTGCTPDQAFAVLTLQSQKANRKLRDIARELVEATAAAGGRLAPAAPDY